MLTTAQHCNFEIILLLNRFLGRVGLEDGEEGEDDDGSGEAGPDDGEQPLHGAAKLRKIL